MNIEAIKKRVVALKAMNDSPELDSFDEKLVCDTCDDVPELLRWVERAAELLDVVRGFTHGAVCIESEKLLAELTDAGEG